MPYSHNINYSLDEDKAICNLISIITKYTIAKTFIFMRIKIQLVVK